MVLLTIFACNYGLAPLNPDWDYESERGGSDASFEFDNDEDGYSVEDGDCDDDNPNIFPGQLDICDKIDNDCDNELDEDAETDQWETNDDTPLFAGEFMNASNFSYEAAISTAYDIDRYQAYISDPIGGFFQINVSLTPLSSETDYVVELNLVENFAGQEVGFLQSSDLGSYGEAEYITQNGRPFYDDGGLYEIIVYSKDGSGCDSTYELAVDFTN